MPARLRTLPIVLALCSGVASQEAMESGLRREGVFGMVRRHEGGPAGGARVVLLARTVGGLPDVGDVDQIVVRADERGRFRAELLPGRPYTVWAERTDPDGVRVSALREAVFPRVPVVLDLPARPCGRVSVVTRDLAAWSDRGPFRWRVVVRAENVIVAGGEIAPGAEAVELPVLPAAGAELAIVDRSGGLLTVQRFAVPVEGVRSVTPDLSPPPGVWLFARAIDSGEPVPDASVLRMSGGTAVEIARTDGDGLARVPSAIRPVGRLFVAAPGLAVAPVQEGAAAREPGAWPPIPRDVEPACHVHLGDGVAISGRILLAPDRPAAGCTLIVDERAMHHHAVNSRTLVRLVRSVPTAADGRFRLGSLLAEFPPCVSLALDDATIARLPAAWLADGLFPVIPGAFVGSPSWTREVELPELKLSDCVPVRVSVMASDGAPAAHAVLSLAPLLHQAQVSSSPPLEVVADRRGVATLLLPRSTRLVLGAAHDGNVGVWAVATEPGAHLESPIDLPIRLAPCVVLRGRAVDPAGTPAAGTAIRLQAVVWGTRQGDGDLARAPAVRHPRLGPIGDAVDARGMRDAVQRAVGDLDQAVRTDDSGAFEFRLPSLPMRVVLRARDGDRPVARFDGIPDEVVEIEVPHPR